MDWQEKQMRFKQALILHVNRYRIIVAIGFIVTVVLVLIFPVKMIGSSTWAYYYGVKNFSHGDFVISDQLYTAQINDAQQKGGVLQQYVQISEDKWALEKAPGYVFYMVPFEWLNIPRWGDILLTLGMTIVTYLLLKRIRNEKSACIGSLLMLFTPVTLIMLNIIYLDTLASLAFLVMGGGLYIYYQLERNNLRPLPATTILFLAFFLTGWSVVTRYTNFPVAAILALHFIITRIIAFSKGERKKLYLEVIPVVLGTGLSVAALLIYNNAVFGSPWDYGYKYTRFAIKFAYEYIGRVDKFGQSIPIKIILDNLERAPGPLFWGFPILVIGIPGFITVLYFKFKAMKQGSDSSGRWSSLNIELPWDILLVFIGWFISVFFLYLTYEFSAEYLTMGKSSSLIRFSRFYLPGLFPLVIICALVIARLPSKINIPVTFITILTGSIIYALYIG